MNSSLPDLLDSTTKTVLSSPVTLSSSMIAVPSIETTTNIHSVFNQDDAIRIFQNKTVVFFGEGPIRSIYCDLCKLLHNSKILNSLEIKKHFNYHPPYVNETILELRKKCPWSDHIDIRRYCSKRSSTILFFIHVGTIVGETCPVNIEWLKKITENMHIDLVVMSSDCREICDRELQRKNEQFNDKLQSFKSKLSMICSSLELAFPQSIMMWLPPHPLRNLNDEQTIRVEKFTNICFDISCNQFNFNYLKHDQNLIKFYEELYEKDQSYLLGAVCSSFKFLNGCGGNHIIID
ncbi:unnamed protein product [Rotaria sordida]|uniref:Uncharacterized protein n=1 Tax=Rotaria sordida TaxID=392033 RepID=A0A815DNE9_9BILA|nr:unnamed protein product [Rotaria sordida]